jgi:tol-pal system beta propeller repeat protein TolB
MRSCVILFIIIIVCLASASSVQAEVIRLTEDGTNKRDPRFINNGKTLIFCYDDGPDLIRMMRMDMAKRRPEPVFRDAGNRHNLEPSFSPDGKFVAFTQCTGNLTARLVIRNQETKAEAYITHRGRGGTRSPVFSPDGKRVIYAFAETGPQQLWSVDTDGKNKKQLTECSGISNWPTFTPDGKTIVFSNSRENNYELYATAVDGSSERRLTNNTMMDIRPAVSPDGKQIAFVSTRSGSYDVFVMNIDGSNVRQMTSSEERDDFPTWHPNGRQIVFVSERDGDFDVYLIDVSDGKLTKSE